MSVTRTLGARRLRLKTPWWELDFDGTKCRLEIASETTVSPKDLRELGNAALEMATHMEKAAKESSS